MSVNDIPGPPPVEGEASFKASDGQRSEHTQAVRRRKITSVREGPVRAVVQGLFHSPATQLLGKYFHNRPWDPVYSHQ